MTTQDLINTLRQERQRHSPAPQRYNAKDAKDAFDCAEYGHDIPERKSQRRNAA